jgi:hypothetical protein
MTEPQIQLLDDLGAEFERVALSQEKRPRRRMPWLRWRTPLLVAFVSLVLAGGALAALDVLPVGTELPAEKVRGPGEPTYTSPRTVVATGHTADLNWFVTVTASDQGRCIGLWLDSKLGRSGTDICGGPESFDAASVGGGDVLPDTTLVFGPAPEDAAEVRVTAPGGFSRATPTHDGPDDIVGNTFVIELPRRGLSNVLVNWLDENRRTHGPGIYVPSTISSSEPAGPQRPN